MSSNDFRDSGEDVADSGFRLSRLGLIGKSPSPDFIQDEESASICPLLTPNSASPTDANPLAVSLEQKMLLVGKSPSPDFTQDEEAALLAPSPVNPPYSVDPLRKLALERQGTPSSGNGDAQLQDEIHKMDDDPISQGNKTGKNDAVDSSGSSGSFALQESNPCELLTTHLYHQLNKDKINDVTTFITQETCSKQTDDTSGRRQGPPDYCFLAWNWPMIRKSCFWTAVSIAIACFCIVVGMIATVPKRCYPYRRWYQGSVFYEIFPASFQDSNHDGIGDLRGIASRGEYLAKLGISAIRLNSIFPANHYPEGFKGVTNLTEIEKTLGDMRDFKYLETVMRSKNISIVLDLPIYPLVEDLGERRKYPKEISDRITNAVNAHRSHRSIENETNLPQHSTATKISAQGLHGKYNSETIVMEALRHWFDNGVDGVYIKGLENYCKNANFISELKKWKMLKESYRNGKMLMCDYRVLEKVDAEETVEVLLETMDLLDVHLDLTNGTNHIKKEVNKYRESRIYDKRGYSWLHWNIGDVDTRRLSTRVENNLGAILFQNLLPGTVSIFYGDEIGLQEIADPHSDRTDIRHIHQLAPMKWNANGTGFTRSDILPWLPFAKSYKSSQKLESILSRATNLRMDSPSIYMNSIWKENENLSNHAFRYVDQNLIVLERSYPRRKSYAVIFNIGGTDVEKDLSTLYYGGELVQDVKGNHPRYITFNRFRLPAGESYIFKLDT